MNEEAESGGRIANGCENEKIDGFEDVSETATDIVCIRLVRLKDLEHFWFLMKIMSST